MNKKILLIIVLIIAVIGVIYLKKNATVQPSFPINNVPNVTNINAVCTEEAKICPDGSSVSRTGPNCEFAPCP